MSRNNRRICVKAPEIVMSGDIKISAAIAVSTKASNSTIDVELLYSIGYTEWSYMVFSG